MKNAFKANKSIFNIKKSSFCNLLLLATFSIVATTKVGLSKIQYCLNFQSRKSSPGNPSDQIIPHSKMAPSQKGFASK